MSWRLPPAIAIFGVFFAEAAVLGHWIPRIPDIKSALSLSDGALGLSLLALPFGTLVGLTVAGKVLGRTGLRDGIRIFLPLWALLFVLPGLAPTMTLLMLSLALCGFAIGLVETAMNTEAARLEPVLGKRLMSRCHGFWSLGTMTGALLGGAIAHQGIAVAPHFLLVMPMIAIFGYAVASALPPVVVPTHADKTRETLPDEAALDQPLFRLPARAILLLAFMPLGIMMVEGAFIDWSAVFMRDVMSASPMIIGVTYAMFSVVMAVVRLGGDALATRFGDVAVVRASGAAATVGVALFALSPNTAWALAAATLAGAGVAVVFPLSVGAAARRPGRSPVDNVAALNMIAFSAFLLAPPLIGFLSEAFGLRMALLALTPLAFTTWLLAGEVGRG